MSTALTDCPASALAYAANRDRFVFPADLTDGKKKKSHKSAEYSNGAAWGKTKDPNGSRHDFKRWPDAGFGIPTGEVNGIFVIEADTLKAHGVDGLKSLEVLQRQYGELPDTLMAESPSGSVHRFYRHPGQYIPSSSSKIAPGVDIKGDGGMVIAPPSKREDGIYRRPNDLPIAEAPAWLIEQAIVAGSRQARRCKRRRASASDEWRGLLDNIRNGRALHDSLRDLAAEADRGRHERRRRDQYALWPSRSLCTGG